MKNYLLPILISLIVSGGTFAHAQQTPSTSPVSPPGVQGGAAAKEVKDKESAARPDTSKTQREAIKSRRDHRRTVTHRLRRRV